MVRRLRPLAEREAVWAFALALLGTVSMYLTLPAALWLSGRCIRGRTRGGDGSEPAIGALSIALVGLAVMMGLPLVGAIVLSTLDAGDLADRWSLVVGWAILAATLGLLVSFMLRSHPERWLARRAAVAGVIVIATAGLLEMTSNVAGGCNPFGRSAVDCVSSTPWLALGPALFVGGAWLAFSLVAAGMGRLARGF